MSLFFLLIQIWEAVDPRQDGYVTRDGLYKALALTALAQQGKIISERALEQFVDSGMVIWQFPLAEFWKNNSSV